MEIPSKGFLYAASVEKKFLTGAIYSATSLKDYYPKAHVTLFTHKEWVTDDLYNTFDHIVTEDVPNNARAKLWALSRTPYKHTVYLDSDTEILHEDISTIFDYHTKGIDLMITKIRPYSGKISEFPGGNLTDHCGMFMYRSNKRTIEFMNQWYQLWLKQSTREWNWDTELYPEELRSWDQWTYWWLQNQTKYSIKRAYLQDDARWNFINTYKEDETDKPIVVYHHTLPKDMI